MQSQVCTAAVLLTLLQLCSCSLVANKNFELQSVSIDYSIGSSHKSTGTVNRKGLTSGLSQAAEAPVTGPTLFIGKYCSTIDFNRLHQKHELSVPITIDGRSLLNDTNSNSSKVQNVTITGIDIHVSEVIRQREKEIFSMRVNLLKPSGRAELQILCNSIASCRQLSEELDDKENKFLLSMKFTATGKAGSTPVRFGDVKAQPVASLDCPNGRWSVFQRRTDNTLSFAQNWDTYAKGFGSADANSNYWMGLDQLSQKTGRNSTDCHMRMETVDRDGAEYWGEWQSFKVLSADRHYELNLDKGVNGTMFDSFQAYHNQKKFSTSDKVHSSSSSNAVFSCPELYGNGGWWFGDCFQTYLNGRMLVTKNNDTTSGIWSMVDGKGYVQMVRSLMMFKCM